MRNYLPSLAVLLPVFLILTALGGGAARAVAQGGVCYVEMVCCGCDGENCYIYDQCYAPTCCYGPSCTGGNCQKAGVCEFQCDGTIHFNEDYCSNGGSSFNLTPKQCSKPRVLSAALRLPAKGQDITHPAVSISVPPDMPLQLVKVEGPMRSPVPYYQYTLRNIGARSIVALSVRWNIYVDEDPAPKLSKVSTVDNWAAGSDSWLGPNQENSFMVTEAVTGGGKQVTRMEGIPVYIEFNDGSRSGSEAGPISARLTKMRQQMLEEFRRALSTYEASGQQELNYELAQDVASRQANEGRAFAAGIVLSKIREKGMPAAVAYLTKAAVLQVPL